MSIYTIVKATTLHLVTFGCGERFRRNAYKPIRNRDFVKPDGGLWASPINVAWGWKQWAEREEYGDLSTWFEFDFRGRVLKIDKLKDLIALPRRHYDGYREMQWPDYEAILARGVDAIHLTEKGESETRFSNPNLYGWDCECVLVMNADAVQVR